MKRFKLVLIAVLGCAAVFSCEALNQGGGDQGGDNEIPETEILGISITQSPTRKVYGLGETLDLTGLVVTAAYSGAPASGQYPVTAANLSMTAAPETAGSGTPVTVTVNDHIASFTIDVFPVVSKKTAGTYTGRNNLNIALSNAVNGDVITIYNNQTISNNKNPNGKTITLQGYGAERKITHTSPGKLFNLSGANTTLILGDKLTLDGEGNNNGNDPLVCIESGATLLMNSGSKITGGKNTNGSEAGGSGGVTVDGGTFIMEDGTISENSTTGGGGVFVTGSGTFTMSGGTISGNTADYYGGGVFIYSDSSFTMEGGTISGNTGIEYGGGVDIFAGTFIMVDGTISGNTSPYGGGVEVYLGTFTMEGGTISGNMNSEGVNVGFGGGGVCITDGGTFTMVDGTIDGNIGGEYGGGVVVLGGGTFNMVDGTISGNSAVSDGGGVDAFGGTFIMDGGAISGNSAIHGGGIDIYEGTFTFNGGTIAGNIAPSGSQVWQSRSSIINGTVGVLAETTDEFPIPYDVFPPLE